MTPQHDPCHDSERDASRDGDRGSGDDQVYNGSAARTECHADSDFARAANGRVVDYVVEPDRGELTDYSPAAWTPVPAHQRRRDQQSLLGPP
jgi:hypothetical protein